MHLELVALQELTDYLFQRASLAFAAECKLLYGSNTFFPCHSMYNKLLLTWLTKSVIGSIYGLPSWVHTSALFQRPDTQLICPLANEELLQATSGYLHSDHPDLALSGRDSQKADLYSALYAGCTMED